MAHRSKVFWSGLLAAGLLLAGCGGGDVTEPLEAGAAAAIEAKAQSIADKPSAPATCAKGGLVDAGFRDAALAVLAELAVQAPGQAAHGAIRFHMSPGHIDPQGQPWHFVQAYQANLAMQEALRVAPHLHPMAGDWLRWQARHMRTSGTGRGVVFDRWIRASDLKVAACPPGGPAPRCPDVDSYDSTAASMLLVANAYRAAGGDLALLREVGMRSALRTAAGAMAALAQPHGLTWAKADHPVAYLMDAVEVAAGWRAWARVQVYVYGDGAGAAASLASAQRVEDAVRSALWHVPSQAWRVAVESGAPDFSVWYADTVAQAWPLLWGVQGPQSGDAAGAWQRASARWLGANDWSRRNVDPDGFWWPAAAAAAQCVGDLPSARTWVARARRAWMRPGQPFAWPFHVGDLRWLFWMADPVPAR